MHVLVCIYRYLYKKPRAVILIMCVYIAILCPLILSTQNEHIFIYFFKL